MSNLKRDADGDVVCQECGCEGNSRCGHNPPQWAMDNGKGCALDSFLICPCCNEKRWAANGAKGCPIDLEPCDGCAGVITPCADAISPNIGA